MVLEFPGHSPKSKKKFPFILVFYLAPVFCLVVASVYPGLFKPVGENRVIITNASAPEIVPAALKLDAPLKLNGGLETPTSNPTTSPSPKTEPTATPISREELYNDPVLANHNNMVPNSPTPYAPKTSDSKSITLLKPQPAGQIPEFLVRFRQPPDLKSGGPSLIETLVSLDPVRAGRLQALNFTQGKNGEGDQLLAIIAQADEPLFKAASLDYSKLDTEPDSARYYSVIIPDKAPPPGERSWLDPDWQVLDQVGNRVTIKVDLPFYLGFGFRSHLVIDKIPPRVNVPGLVAPCPCPELAKAAFSSGPISTALSFLSKETSKPLNEAGVKETLTELSGKVKEEQLKEVVSQLAQNEVQGKPLNTRYTGSRGTVYIAERIFTYFFALGLTVEYDSFLEGGLGTISTNVVAEHPGENKTEPSRPVFLIGHYDTLGERNLKGLSSPKILAYGANDNGVGIAGLMEVARLLAPKRLDQPVRFIAFGSEEQGMLGSQHYSTYHVSPAKPTAILNIDSFGYNPGGADWVVLGYNRYGIGLKNDLVNWERKYNIGVRLEPHGGEPFFRSDDYYFDQLGYKSIALTDSFSLQSPNNHTPNDTLPNVNFVTTCKIIQLSLVAVAEWAGLIS